MMFDIALDANMALHADGFIEMHTRETALETPRLRMLADSGIPLAMIIDAFRAARTIRGSRQTWRRSPTLHCLPRLSIVIADLLGQFTLARHAERRSSRMPPCCRLACVGRDRGRNR